MKRETVPGRMRQLLQTARSALVYPTNPHEILQQFSLLHSAPTMVIAGDHDVIRPAHTLQIFENIPASYLWILPNSGHYTLVGYADEFNKKTDSFFKARCRKIEDRDREF